MITIYGASDDLIEVEGDIDEEFNALGDEAPQLLAFSDGNVLRIVYSGTGVWRISPVVYGSGEVTIVQAPEDDDGNYSDRATIDGQLQWVVFGSAFARSPR